MEKAKKVKVIKLWSQVFCIFFSFIAVISFYAYWTKGFSYLVVGSLIAATGLGINCYLLSRLADDAAKRLSGEGTG